MRGGDYTIPQDWAAYGAEEHSVWRALFRRQRRLLAGRATEEFLAGLGRLAVAADRVPDFRPLNEVLASATGWRVVAVPGLVPDEVFFAHLAARRFPAARFIRRRAQLDYLEEPDIFHDVFGHVPMLLDPAFADFMQAYGVAGLEARDAGALRRLARLYWYTVEFGLIDTAAGLRIFGAGIVSSRAESVFALEDPSPNRVGFRLERVMRTAYRIDDFQETYFVIDDAAFLRRALTGDLRPAYAHLAGTPDLAPAALDPGDVVFTRGTGAHARASRSTQVIDRAEPPMMS